MLPNQYQHHEVLKQTKRSIDKPHLQVIHC